jgi:hypothetical protein
MSAQVEFTSVEERMRVMRSLGDSGMCHAADIISVMSSTGSCGIVFEEVMAWVWRTGSESTHNSPTIHPSLYTAPEYSSAIRQILSSSN